jgi:predicted MFS family arabinose efflux permease
VTIAREEAPGTAAPPSDLRRLALLLGAMFVLAASNGVVFPLLPRLQDTYDLPTWGLGVLTAAAFLVGLVTQLTVAPLADRGHAKALLILGLAIAIAGALLFAVGTALGVFVIARALTGLSIGCFVPAARAIAATTDERHVARNLGYLASVETGGFVLGPVLGAALAEVFGLKVPFVVFAGLALVALVVVSTRRLPEYGGDGVSSRPSLALLQRRGVVVAALLALALFLPVGVYDALWGRYLEDRGASTLFIGVSLALYGVPFFLLAAAGGRVADRVGPVRAALRTMWLVVPMTAAYGLLQVPLAIMLLACAEAGVQAIAIPAAQAAMARACPTDRIAAGQGLAGAVQLAGAAGTALVAAPLYDAVGPEAVFGSVAVVIGLLALTAAVLHRGDATAR